MDKSNLKRLRTSENVVKNDYYLEKGEGFPTGAPPAAGIMRSLWMEMLEVGGGAETHVWAPPRSII